ncbi:MAG: DNA polymerase I [Spirochaetales bacterium]|jgi:DNA polymerase I|nr:DNA polymerase I [Spirochaetales bacterium]
MSDKAKTLILIDGMALAYRGHFAMTRNPRFTRKKVNTSAIYVFANALADLLQTYDPTHIAVVFDTPEPTHRHKIYKEYKETRDAMPEDLQIALPYIDRLCGAFMVPALRYPGWEADDVIGTLAHTAENEGFTTYMVTPDKDYAQLVAQNTYMCKPSSGGGLEILGIPEICELWEIQNTDQVIDILGLMGDASDNIPGVPGIGKKTAQKLISEYQSMEGVYQHLEELKGKQKENLEANREKAFFSKELVTIVRDVPIKQSLDDLIRKEWNVAAVNELFGELEFATIGRRLLGAEYADITGALFESGESVGGMEIKNLDTTEHNYGVAATAGERQELLRQLEGRKEVCFDLETTGLDEKICEIVGIAFTWVKGKGHFLVVPDNRNDAIAILHEFAPFFSNPDCLKIGHNIKFDLSVLRWHDIKVAGPFFDTMIAAYLCVPDMRRTMDALAEEYLHYQTVHIEELIGEKGKEQKTMREVPIEKISEYACEDTDITFQLKEHFTSRLAEFGQMEIFSEIECPLLPVLVEMERAGIKVDVSALDELSKQLVIDIERVSARIEVLAGESFNIKSPKQLGEVLFDKLKLDSNAKRTKKTGQYITNEQVLSRLAPRHEIVEKILEFRMMTKLKSTYVDMLPEAIFERTGRVHTSYEQAVTATGRMQSHDPNLQNIPIRTDSGKEIRRAFVAEGDQYLLLAADYSQIELRIAAALSKESAMIKAFEENIDIHTATAMKLFDTGEETVTADMRRHAKTVNFGILYGISAFGLSERSDLSRGEAADLINNYFAQYPMLKLWQEETISFAHDNGYVETITGRRRYLREINSRNAAARSGAERNAINAPIQGTAADMIKRAMSIIQSNLVKKGLESRMLLQVHDELVFEVLQEEREIVTQIVTDGMVGALPLNVPIVVEVGAGRTWLDAH